MWRKVVVFGEGLCRSIFYYSICSFLSIVTWWRVTVDVFWIDGRIFWTLWCSAWLHLTVHYYTYKHTSVHSHVFTAVAWYRLPTADVPLPLVSRTVHSLLTSHIIQILTDNRCADCNWKKATLRSRSYRWFHGIVRKRLSYGPYPSLLAYSLIAELKMLDYLYLVAEPIRSFVTAVSSINILLSRTISRNCTLMLSCRLIFSIRNFIH
jgi:hypothetical protein